MKSKRALKVAVAACIITVLLSVSVLANLAFHPQYPTHLPPQDDGARERNLVIYLQEMNYTFMLPREYFAGNHSGKIALLLHDADDNLDGLNKFLSIETELGVKSAFYPRPDAEWFSQNVRRLQAAEAEGWEVGFQYDCLSRADGNNALAMMLFRGQLAYMQTLFNVSTTTYHNDSYNVSILNFNLYSGNIDVWAELGLHEVYSVQNYSYFSDAGGVLAVPTLPYEDLVVVQLHTDWTR